MAWSLGYAEGRTLSLPVSVCVLPRAAGLPLSVPASHNFTLTLKDIFAQNLGLKICNIISINIYKLRKCMAKGRSIFVLEEAY